METIIEQDSRMRDFYNEYDPLDVTASDKKAFDRYYNSLDEDEKKMLESGLNYYSIKFKNEGGLIMPIIMEFQFADGTSEVVRIPAEIWRKNHEEVNKVFYFEKEVTDIVLDPFLETADTERNNNYWPPRQEPSRFELFKRRSRGGRDNPMQKARKEAEMSKGEESGSGK